MIRLRIVCYQLTCKLEVGDDHRRSIHQLSDLHSYDSNK